jgi:O-antigen/teichoic acid export membrane protein
MIKHISLLTFPIMGILWVCAADFIASVYGDKWAPAAAVLRILCVVGAIRSIATTIGSVLYAKGRADISFKMNLFQVVYHAAGFILGLRWGIQGVATAYAIITITTLPLDPYLLKRIIALPYRSFVGAVFHQTAGCAVMVLALVLIRPWLGAGSFAVAALSMSGVLFYASFLFLSNRQLLAEASGLLKRGQHA